MWTLQIVLSTLLQHQEDLINTYGEMMRITTFPVFNKSYLEQNSSCFSPSPLAQTNLVQGGNPEVFLHCVASHPWTSPNSRPSSFMGVNCSAELRPALIWNWLPWSPILSMPICSGDLDSLLCFIPSGSSAFSPLVYCSAGSRPIGVYTWCSIGSKAVAASHHVCSLARKELPNLQRLLINFSGLHFSGWQDDPGPLALHYNASYASSTSSFPAANLLLFLTLSCLKLLFLSCNQWSSTTL